MAKIKNIIQDAVVLFEFFGADTGAVPSGAATDSMTVTVDSVEVRTNAAFVDVAPAGANAAMHRAGRWDSEVVIVVKMETPDELIGKWQSDGPLTKVTITNENPTEAADAGDDVYEFSGNMAHPDVSWRGDGCEATITIKSYGTNFSHSVGSYS